MSRKVATPNGARFYKRPIGSPIDGEHGAFDRAFDKHKTEAQERQEKADLVTRAASLASSGTVGMGGWDHWQTSAAQETYRALFKMQKESKYIDPDVTDAMARLRAAMQMQMDAEAAINKKGPVDGDGDGFVYDGTPRKRPATPAEEAAGARLRAQRGGGGAGARPAAAAAKKAPAKNDYDKRVDKFDRAINQAVKAGDKKEVKRCHDLIGQDFILKAPDRNDLQAVLAARAAGKPDPAPLPGSNRAVRMPKQVRPAAPAAPKAPAAKKVAAKKVAAPPAKKAAAQKPASANQRRTPALRQARAANAKANLASVVNPPAHKQTSFGNLPDGPETKAYEALAAAKNDADVRAVVQAVNRAADAGQIDPAKAAGVRREADRVRARLKTGPKTPSVIRRLRSALAPKTTTPGPGKDLAAVEQAIKGATNNEALDRIKANLNRPEAKPLRDYVRNNPMAMKRLNNLFKEKRLALKAPSSPKTVQPKMPPNEARAKAKANLPASWNDRLNHVDQMSDPNKRLSVLEDLMSALEADKELPDSEFQHLADELNARMDDVDNALNALARVKGRFTKGIDPKHQEALDKHFAGKSASIADAPKEGLYQYLVQSPERFDVKRQEANKGVSGIDVITDKVTGERWFAKHSEFKNDYGREKMAGDLLNMLGLSKHKVAVSIGNRYERYDGFGMKGYTGQVLLTQDALQGNGLDGELKRASDMSPNEIAKAIEEVIKGLEAGDPQGLVNLMAFDYLIDNTVDRHASNAFFQRKGGTMKVQFVDQGLAFGGFQPDDMTPHISPGTWFRDRYRANDRGGWDIAQLIGKSTKGRDDVARRMEEAAKSFQKRLDFKKIKAMYAEAFKDDPLAMRNFDAMINMLEVRLQLLNDNDSRDALIGYVVRAGGF